MVLGNIKVLNLDIDQPMEMHMQMEFQALCILVGTNGSGKSMLMKLNWALGTIMTSAFASKKSNTSVDTKSITQFVMDNTFSDQNFNGTIISYFENGTLDMKLENGKVIEAGYTIDPQVTEVPTPIFMSTTLRTFSQINQYLKFAKNSTQEQMLEMFRLYDIVFVERLKSALNKGLNSIESFNTRIAAFDGMEKYDFNNFVIENETVYFINKTGIKRDLATLSNGEQSLINMMLNSEL